MHSIPSPARHTLRLARRSCPLGLAVLLAACGAPETPPAAPPTEQVFRCDLRLIGIDAKSCEEDVIGPGELTISFKPDPPESAWDASIDGLTALAQACGFSGGFQRKRLSGLEGRGKAEIACPIAPNVDRPYHQLRFETREATPGTSLGISVVFVRPHDG
jgi:hypothetical protein